MAGAWGTGEAAAEEMAEVLLSSERRSLSVDTGWIPALAHTGTSSLAPNHLWLSLFFAGVIVGCIISA